MKDKLRAVFDNKATWLLIASVAGAFGEKAYGIATVLGNVVMAVW